MASKSVASITLLLSLNLLFFTMVSSATTQPPATCPIDALKLGVCANVLNLVNVVVGSPPQPCCSLLGGLANLEAAVCLCTAIKAEVLGIKVDVPVTLSVILNDCGKKVPSGFQCPS